MSIQNFFKIKSCCLQIYHEENIGGANYTLQVLQITLNYAPQKAQDIVTNLIVG